MEDEKDAEKRVMHPPARPTKPIAHASTAQTTVASSLSAMKKNPKANITPSNKHLRKGGAGGWRNAFTPQESQAFDEIYREEMEGSGLEMDFGEGLIM